MYAKREGEGESEREREMKRLGAATDGSRGGGFGKMWEPARESFGRLSLPHETMKHKREKERK